MTQTTLIQTLKNDKLAYFKSGNKIAATALGILIGDYETKSLKTGVVSDADFLEMIKKFDKSLKQVIPLQIERINELKLSEQTEENISKLDKEQKKLEKFEIEASVIEKYLGKKYSDEELFNVIYNHINNKDCEVTMPSIMKILKEHHKDKYDGATASKMIKERIL